MSQEEILFQCFLKCFREAKKLGLIVLHEDGNHDKPCRTCVHHGLEPDGFYPGAIKEICKIARDNVTGEMASCVRTRMNSGTCTPDGKGGCSPNGARWEAGFRIGGGPKGRCSCCDAWKTARRGEHPAIWKDEEGAFVNGSVLPVKFCPWCGKKK